MKYMMPNQNPMIKGPNQMGQGPKGGQEMIKGDNLRFRRMSTPKEMLLGSYNNNPVIRSTGNMMGNNNGWNMAGNNNGMNYNPALFSPSLAGQGMKGNMYGGQK